MSVRLPLALHTFGVFSAFQTFLGQEKQLTHGIMPSDVGITLSCGVQRHSFSSLND